MPFLLIKMFLSRFLPHLIAVSAFLTLSIIGLVYFFDGWNVFFTVSSLLVFTIAIVSYYIYLQVKAQINAQKEMFSSMMNMLMPGEDTNDSDSNGEGVEDNNLDIHKMMMSISSMLGSGSNIGEDDMWEGIVNSETLMIEGVSSFNEEENSRIEQRNDIEDVEIKSEIKEERM